jgi:hypothetical protein
MSFMAISGWLYRKKMGRLEDGGLRDGEMRR